MKKLVAAVILFAAAILLAGYISYSSLSSYEKNSGGEYAVAVNEISQLCAMGDTAAAEAKANELMTTLQSPQRAAPAGIIPVMTGICLVFLAGVSVCCYFSVIRPFHKLTSFADRIADGDLDLPLDYTRTDYFGKFTWAFDRMRREILKARACEKEAVENNKTVIASLSHDLKTPVASIRAYAEGLEAGMALSPEKRAKYISVIMRKCDEVTRLTNDMLLHSLSDMDKLKTEPICFELGGLIGDLILDMNGEKNDIRFKNPPYPVSVFADPHRTEQIAENLIANAVKYAGIGIDVSITRDERFASVHVRDFGKGIPDEDMPFVTEKFYRGHNCENAPGSGLGLYIVKYLASGAGGELRLINHQNGLEAVVTLPLSEG